MKKEKPPLLLLEDLNLYFIFQENQSRREIKNFFSWYTFTEVEMKRQSETSPYTIKSNDETDLNLSEETFNSKFINMSLTFRK